MKRKYFKYVVLIAVLFIPFIYGFFYLKAYWNPYGSGNIDNIPVAVVNDDKGDKGSELVTSIKKSKKLKINVVDNDEAINGLSVGKYYALIKIPSDFTNSMLSASTSNKRHATITYSSNQKSNYLASQIINNVVNVVEKNLDNSVDSQIVSKLSNTLNTVPKQLETISNGFTTIIDGTNKLENGSNELVNGSKKIKSGISQAYDGSMIIAGKVNNSILSLKNDTSDAIDANTLNSIKAQAKSSVDNLFTNDYKNVIGIQAVNQLKTTYQQSMKKIEAGLFNYGITDVQSYCTQSDINPNFTSYCNSYVGLLTLYNQLNDNNSVLYKSIVSVSSASSYEAAVQTSSTVSEKVAKEVATNAKKQATEKTISSLTQLSEGLNSLTLGLAKLDSGSSGLYSGTTTLNTGINQLNMGIKNSKIELDNKISSSGEELQSLNGIDDYSSNPVNVAKTPSNEISSYGTAFAPLFISIALWVGCLMAIIVLYYDKESRFGILGIDSKKYVKRTLLYHFIASLSAIILGILLMLLLDFNITNVFLYFITLILVANLFMAIISFLVFRFADIGKFLALIILVLQLAASGGTFPIETVTKGFRWMHNFLPMTYTIRLIRESLVTIEKSLLSKNMIIVIIIFLVFFIINLIIDIYKEKKNA